MARRIIAGTLNYSSTTNRDAAFTRITNALVSFAWTSHATTLPAGVNKSGSGSITISIQVDDRDEAFNSAKAIYDAAVQSLRHVSGFLSVNRV